MNQKRKKPTKLTPNPTATIPLHDGQICIIDACNLEWLSCYSWLAVKKMKSWYAYTMVQGPRTKRRVAMHRMVNKTPSRKVCHHRNRNGLDNREENLIAMDKTQHRKLHRDHSFTRKIAADYDGIVPYMEG